MVEVCALFYKIPLNKPNDNYCRGVCHKPPLRVYLVSVMVGLPLWDMDKSIS